MQAETKIHSTSPSTMSSGPNGSVSVTCQNCKKDFTIESEDFNFYEKIKVPPPTWCPECRLQRRLAWRNEKGLHYRECDLCKKKILLFIMKILKTLYIAKIAGGAMSGRQEIMLWR